MSGEEDRCTSCGGLWRLEGRYEALRLIGEGTVSRVFEGRDLETGRAVAIKVLELRRARDFKVMELFARGHAILGGLRHEGLAKVFAFVDDEGTAYQVREYFAAGSLEDSIRRGERFDRKSVHVLLNALLEILGYLHSRAPRVLHRDVKPGNIMLRDNGGGPVLVDFDTALGAVERNATTIVVSAGYTAPEQLGGEAEPASDLYSLGMTMLFVLSGKHPHDLPRQAGKPVLGSLLASLEPATSQVISRLVEPDLSKRYRSASDALRGMRGLVERGAAVVPAQASGSVWTREVRVFGLSLFRIAVGVLLGILLFYSLLIFLGPSR